MKWLAAVAIVTTFGAMVTSGAASSTTRRPDGRRLTWTTTETKAPPGLDHPGAATTVPTTDLPANIAPDLRGRRSIHGLRSYG